MTQYLTPQVRKSIYIVVGAVLAILTLYKVIDPAQAPGILDVVGGLLGVAVASLAAPNVPKE